MTTQSDSIVDTFFVKQPDGSFLSSKVWLVDFVQSKGGMLARVDMISMGITTVAGLFKIEGIHILAGTQIRLRVTSPGIVPKVCIVSEDGERVLVDQGYAPSIKLCKSILQLAHK